MLALTRLHLTIVTFATIQRWLPLIGLAGAAVLAASAAVATTADPRRVRR
jgi:hypothetical protein